MKSGLLRRALALLTSATRIIQWESRSTRELRESEARFRSLVELSFDTYWEQDAQHRFTLMRGAGPAWRDPTRRSVLGLRRWDVGYVNVSDREWAAHRAALDAHQPFSDLELCLRNEAGRDVWSSASGEPMFDESGAFKGYRGVSKDITERKHAELARTLEHAVNRLLAVTENDRDAITGVLRTLCQVKGWEYGEFFRLDEQAGVMRLDSFWHAAGVRAALREFAENSRGVLFEPGVGLLGLVWQTEQPLWVTDMDRDPRVVRRNLVASSLMRGALLFPVIAQGKTIGVMSISSLSVREPDERLLDATKVIGNEVGQYLYRKQAERVLRESEERFRSVTYLSSDVYWEQDANFRYTRLIGPSQLGSQSMLGKTRWEQAGLQLTDAEREQHIKLLNSHRPFREFITRFVHPDGRRRFVSTSGEPVFGEDGTFRGYRGTARDVTEAMRREEVLVRFRAAMDVSPDLILMIDPASMRYVDANHAACQAIGYSREELLAIGPHDIFSATRDELAAVYARLIAGDTSGAATEGLYRRRDGSPMTVEAIRHAVRTATGNVIVSVARDIRDRLQREEQLRLSNERFNIIARATNDVIRDHNLLDNRVWWNENVETMLGLPRDELRPEARTWLGNIHPDDTRRVAARFDALLASSQTTWDEEYRFRRGDGSYAHILDRGLVVRDGTGRATRLLGAMTDITERKQAEQRIRDRELQQSVIAEFGHSALTHRDIEALMRQAVELVARTLGTELGSLLELAADRKSLVLRANVGWRGDSIGTTIMQLESNTAMAAVVREGEPIVVGDYEEDRRYARSALAAQLGVRSSLGVVIPMSDGLFGGLGVQSTRPRHFSTDQVSFLQSIANTLAAAIERGKAEEQLTRLAQFDSITGLPNRVLFRDRLEQVLEQAKRNDWLVAVMFIDLDRFKVVNDRLGHDYGDRLLAAIGARLTQDLRGGDTVGRLSGDEFAVVLPNLARVDDAGLIAQKMLKALSQPLDLDGNRAYTTASVGIAVFPSDGDDAATLLRNADTAMYRVKARGRNSYQFYMPEMNARALERLELETDLRGALERGEFVLRYQPKVRLRGGRICGFEALLRWQHPRRGLISPEHFISLLEDTGLIIPVGEWVLREVCRQIQAWAGDGLEIQPVSVNLSARQFQQSDLDQTIRRILADHGVPPALLEIEITESLLMQDSEAAAHTLQALKDSGVGVCVDDFGTGYSSLSYLRRFPLDALKIDRSFIDDLAANGDDAAITSAIINLAHSLKLDVVAEGVEAEAQLAFLAKRGCDMAQGYLFSEPIGPRECEPLLRGERRLATRGHRAPTVRD
jgi:diguanylate cyclase (GGDEF)-like protein/PAS domain S-box-containing protein